MGLELIQTVIVISFCCCILDGSVHAFYLSVGLRAIWLCGLMADAMGLAGQIKAMTPGWPFAAPQDVFRVGKLAAIVG